MRRRKPKRVRSDLEQAADCRRTGRHRIDADDRQAFRVSTYLRQREYHRLREACAADHCTAAELVREALVPIIGDGGP